MILHPHALHHTSPIFCYQASHSSFSGSDRCCKVCYWPAWVTTGTSVVSEGELGDSSLATDRLIIIILTVHWLPLRSNPLTSWLRHRDPKKWYMPTNIRVNFKGGPTSPLHSGVKMQTNMEKIHYPGTRRSGLSSQVVWPFSPPTIFSSKQILLFMDHGMSY